MTLSKAKHVLTEEEIEMRMSKLLPLTEEMLRGSTPDAKIGQDVKWAVDDLSRLDEALEKIEMRMSKLVPLTEEMLRGC